MPETDWLEWRRKGIGGSDAATVCGLSPYRTKRDLYYDKRGIVSVDDAIDNWAALEIGHLLEDLVARIFERKTGYKTFPAQMMFQHPQYPFMLADVDRVVALPDGSYALLEIKTCGYNVQQNWFGAENREIIPIHYLIQGRHYLAVTHFERIYYCCLYDNSEDSVILRRADRDLEFEKQLIYLEQKFWQENVQKNVPPPYTECGELVLESIRRYYGPADNNAETAILDPVFLSNVLRYQQLQEQKKNLDAQVNKLKNEMNQIKGLFADQIGKGSIAVCGDYEVNYKPSYKPTINKDGLLQLKDQYPEIYQKFVQITESRRFSLKKCSKEAT